jgi:aspartate--ammonia ligase
MLEGAAMATPRYVTFGRTAGYEPVLDLRETERAIKKVKDRFESELALALHLERISAPLFVAPETGLNDDLNGIERKVAFGVAALEEKAVEVVQSLAKWKRNALARYGFEIGEGLYTDMNAIRRDETLSNLHSIYVDQWDWELVMRREDRSLAFLEDVVRKIYGAMRKVEQFIASEYRSIPPVLPESIAFVSTQELEDRFPDKTPKEREYIACREHGAVFITKIGGKLRSGQAHDGRAPDYDDWELNGDIVLHHPVLDCAFEVSSMGIRVDEQSLEKQLVLAGCEARRALPFHRAILERRLPQTIGGGLGQSRLCMFYLRKAHVGEVQVSVWPEDVQDECARAGIRLL